MAIDVVDYEIKGSEMQQVEAELDPGEVAVAEAGSLMYMDAGIVMDTEFGDGRQTAGGGSLGKLLSAGRVAVHHRLRRPRVAEAARGFRSALPGHAAPASIPEPRFWCHGAVTS